jgi:hypothetical protein
VALPAALPAAYTPAVLQVVDLRNVLHILEYSDSMGAESLRQHCLQMVVANLDAVLLECRGVIEV